MIYSFTKPFNHFQIVTCNGGTRKIPRNSESRNRIRHGRGITLRVCHSTSTYSLPSQIFASLCAPTTTSTNLSESRCCETFVIISRRVSISFRARASFFANKCSLRLYMLPRLERVSNETPGKFWRLYERRKKEERNDCSLMRFFFVRASVELLIFLYIHTYIYTRLSRGILIDGRSGP